MMLAPMRQVRNSWIDLSKRSKFVAGLHDAASGCYDTFDCKTVSDRPQIAKGLFSGKASEARLGFKLVCPPLI